MPPHLRFSIRQCSRHRGHFGSAAAALEYTVASADSVKQLYASEKQQFQLASDSVRMVPFDYVRAFACAAVIMQQREVQVMNSVCILVGQAKAKRAVC